MAATSKTDIIIELQKETRAAVQLLDEKLDAVKIDYGSRLTAVEAEVSMYREDRKDIKASIGHWELYKEDRKWAYGVAATVIGAVIVLYVTALLPGCAELPAEVSTSTPTAVPVETAEPDDTPTPTATPTIASTPEPTATYTPTFDLSATPTMITPTGSIIEVTPLGGGHEWATPRPKQESVTGTYTARAYQNVRLGPGTSYPVKYRLSAGQTVDVVGMIVQSPIEVWLCLAEQCDEALAWVWQGDELGKLEVEE